MIDFTGTYTDQYQLTMAQAYFLSGKKDQTAIFDYFFRKTPYGGGYTVFAGLEDLLDVLETLRFDERDIEFLSENGFHPDFLEYLKNFRFQGTVYASREGDIVFPTRPILSVEANIIEAQILETLVLNILNFQSLIATKASRMRHVAGDRVLVDFGLRRAQGAGGYYASRAAVIGGFNRTSNVRAGRDYHIPLSGTMAHSFVEMYDDELSAFRDFSKQWSENCVLLVDTYNTLKSGVPNAVTVGKEMEERGHQLKGIRLDSGDLAYLAKKARHMLDEAGLHYVQITASNQLDEFVIKSLNEQKAPIDVFGVGTKLVIGLPDAALDGVYKLAFSGGKPRIKLSETIAKISLPYKKQVYRILNSDDTFLGADVVTLAEESETDIMFHPFEVLTSFSIKDYKKEPLLFNVMEKGKRSVKQKSLSDIAEYHQHRLSLLADDYKRFNNPHQYKVGISAHLKELRDQLIQSHKR